MVVLTGILCFLLAITPAHAAVVTLTQKSVAERALQESYRAQEINLQAQTARFDRAEVLQDFDFNLLVESGFESDKFETFSNSINQPDKTDSFLTTASLTKLFSTGTRVGLAFGRTSVDFDYPAGATTTASNQTQDVIMLSLEQNLLKNFLGRANRAEIRAAEATYKASTITRVTDLQNLVLDSIRLFWRAYVAQETFQEALNARDRYQKLVAAVKKKNSYGYTGPGEYAQIQAELEAREQNVKRESVNYLAAMDELATLLRYPSGTEFKFQISQDVPPVPKFETIDFEKTRLVRSARLRTEAAAEEYTAASSNSYPDLSLVGRLGSAGLDEKSSDAYSEMTSGTHPQYFVGLKFQYQFGSDYLNENKINKKILKELEETRLQRQLLELGDREDYLKRQLQSTYAVVLSAKNQRELREKAAVELNRSYTQGRTDISIFIEALNKYFLSKIDYSRAIGDYQIALNEWAALRDELIPESKEPKE